MVPVVIIAENAAMSRGLVLIVDDDRAVRESTARLLHRAGFQSQCYESGDEFLAASIPDEIICILLDVRMPGTDGLAVLRALGERPALPPVVIITGHGDIPLAVEAMRMGALDFIEKPYAPDRLLETIGKATAADRAPPEKIDPDARALLDQLSWRQRQVLAGILCGHPNKIIAFELGLSVRTVESYRAQLLVRLQVRGTAEAVRFALSAGLSPSEFRDDPEAAGTG
jgi:two-component system response regulator FixJ